VQRPFSTQRPFPVKNHSRRRAASGRLIVALSTDARSVRIVKMDKQKGKH
jgi:hypothetical protein